MALPTPGDVARMREAFFRKTRKTVRVFYAGVAAAAAGCLTFAVTVDATGALLAAGAGLTAGLVLFAISPLIPTTARAARILVLAAPAVGVVIGSVFVDLDDLSGRGRALFFGGFGGFLVAMIAGIALIRRRLAHDDALLLRQKRLGFDPERPSSWLRS